MADEVQVLVGLGVAVLGLYGLWWVLRIWAASGVTLVEVETPVDREREIVAWCTSCGSWNFVTLRPGDGVGDDFTTPEGWRLAEAGNGDRAAWCPMCVAVGKAPSCENGCVGGVVPCWSPGGPCSDPAAGCECCGPCALCRGASC